MKLLGKAKYADNVFVKVKGILVPFYQYNKQFESNYILTTDNGQEFTILKSDHANNLDRLTWSVVTVFGYIVNTADQRKVIHVDHYCSDEEDHFMPIPYGQDYEDEFDIHAEIQ